MSPLNHTDASGESMGNLLLFGAGAVVICAVQAAIVYSTLRAAGLHNDLEHDIHEQNEHVQDEILSDKEAHATTIPENNDQDDIGRSSALGHLQQTAQQTSDLRASRVQISASGNISIGAVYKNINFSSSLEALEHLAPLTEGNIHGESFDNVSAGNTISGSVANVNGSASHIQDHANEAWAIRELRVLGAQNRAVIARMKRTQAAKIEALEEQQRCTIAKMHERHIEAISAHQEEHRVDRTRADTAEKKVAQLQAQLDAMDPAKSSMLAKSDRTREDDRVILERLGRKLCDLNEDAKKEVQALKEKNRAFDDQIHAATIDWNERERHYHYSVDIFRQNTRKFVRQMYRSRAQNAAADEGDADEEDGAETDGRESADAEANEVGFRDGACFQAGNSEVTAVEDPGYHVVGAAKGAASETGPAEASVAGGHHYIFNADEYESQTVSSDDLGSSGDGGWEEIIFSDSEHSE